VDPVPVPASATSSASAGWQTNSVDPTLISYWDGVRYTATMKWNGVQWETVSAPTEQASHGPAVTAWQPTYQEPAANPWQSAPQQALGNQWQQSVGQQLGPAETTGFRVGLDGTVTGFAPKSKFSRLLPSSLRLGRRGTRLAVGVMAVLVLALGAFVGLDRGQSAEATVISAVNSTIADRTANVTLGAREQVGPDSIAISGSGSIDFSQSAMAFDTTIVEDGQRIAMKVVCVGGTVYESVPGTTWLIPGTLS
jgi:hypothetical protein